MKGWVWVSQNQNKKLSPLPKKMSNAIRGFRKVLLSEEDERLLAAGN